MCLACEDQLQRPGRGGDPVQPIDIVEEEIGALVCGGAAGETESEDVGVESHTSVAGGPLEQTLFRVSVGVPDLFVRDAERVSETAAQVAGSNSMTSRLECPL
jgi:hypothetical protein